MTANNRPIEAYQVRKGLVTIGHTAQFEHLQVIAELGIPPDVYEALPGIPLWCDDTWSKAHYIAWYRNRYRIEAVSTEARNRKLEADAAKARAKRGR